MPRKGAVKKGKKNNQLSTTLPEGARHLLDQVVSLRVLGDSHSEVIRHCVMTRLEDLRLKYHLTLLLPAVATTDAAGSPLADDTPHV